MAKEPPLELSASDLPDDKKAPELPAWRTETPAKLPGETPAATPRRRVFLWLLGFLLICAALISVLIWLRPAPKPYFGPVWVSDYQYRPFLTPPFSKQDQTALTGGDYFAPGRIQLKALSASLPSDTIMLYLSGYGVCDAKGRVQLLPVDADPSNPQAYRSLNNVLKIMKQAPARKKLLVLDICWPVDDPYWGRLDVGIAARIAKELDELPDPHRFVLCPCAPGQAPFASPELGRSVFSFFLEEGLRGWADIDRPNPERHGLITVKELAAYVEAKVEQWAKMHLNARQTPLLYGDTDDFPLVALNKGKPEPHLERAPVEPYPAWLVEAWKTRDLWWAQERHRSAPWLFRQVEAAVFYAEQGWQNGADVAPLQKDLTDELGRLDKYYQRIIKAGQPEPLSIARYVQQGKSLDPKRVVAVKEMFKKVSEVKATAAKPEEGEKAAAKIVQDFMDASKQVADPEWTGAIVEMLAGDPFPRRDTLRLAHRLLATRKAAGQYAEAAAVARLTDLADQFDDGSWPVALIRKAFLLAYKGEHAAARSRSFLWLEAALEAAAQKRHDAETLLFARGYVGVAAVDAPLTEALRDIDAVLAKQDILEDALRQLHEAMAVLPGYSAYLDFDAAADPAWRDAAAAAQELQTLLKMPTPPVAQGKGLSALQLNPLIEEARTKSEALQSSLRQLKQKHAPEDVEALISRSKRPDADVQVYRDLLAQWALPFHAPELRAKIWEARSSLAGKLTAKVLDTDADIHAWQPHDEADFVQDLAVARSLTSARGARSLALLRLAGLEPAQLHDLEKKLDAFGSAKADGPGAPVEIRDGYDFASALRNAWTDVLPHQIAALKSDTAQYERVSRVAPAWLRLGPQEETLAKAASVNEQKNDRALWGWLADRYRYAAGEGDAPPFVARAAFTLRDYAAKQTAGLFVPAFPTAAELTPAKPAQTVTVPLRWQTGAKKSTPVSFQVFDPHEEWLQLEPNLDTIAELAKPLPEKGELAFPVRIALKPQAEFSVAPRPAGVLLGFRFQGRTYHHKIALPQLPAAGRLDILVSADPRRADVPLGDLRLRPSKERQAFYVYVNNLDEKSRLLIVELRANDTIVPGGRLEMLAPAKRLTRVEFAKGPATQAPAPAPPAAPATPDAKAEPLVKELPELTGPLDIRVMEKDKPLEVIASREIRVDVAQPREYVRVSAIRFEPPGPANGGKNRLDVTVQAVRKLSGPPCPVELVLPKDRIEGLKTIRTGTYRGDLPADGSPLKLTAGELEFEQVYSNAGVIYLNVDGIARAFLFRTSFPPIGEPTVPREELRPALRLSTGRYYRTNTKFEAAVEVDNAPASAQLQVSLGNKQGGEFEPEIRHSPLTPRQKRIGFSLRPADGGIEFDALLRDWRVPFEAIPVRGPRVVQARLLDSGGVDVLPPVYQEVLFDDHVPERVAFLNLPKKAKRNSPFILKATGVDAGVGLKEVAFYSAQPDADGKFPANTPKIDAKPAPGEPDVWLAIVTWPDRTGPLDVSARFTNNLNLSAFATGTVELMDVDPEKSALGTIEGVVSEGPRPQTGVKVILSDKKGNKLAEEKTKEGGTFAFVNLPPGDYVVTASKPTSGRPLSAKSNVSLAPGQTVRLKMELFL